MEKKCDYGYQYSPEPRNTDLNPNVPHPESPKNQARRVGERDEVTSIENPKGSPERRRRRAPGAPSQRSLS